MKKLILTTFLLTALLPYLNGQGNSHLENLWPVEDEFFVGFAEPLSGTQIDYFPFLEKGYIALYVGENGLHPEVSFKTEPI
ncbi:MAG: hypothetical protein PVH48_06730, partial [Cyclobacteriaceae bacterium]